MIGVPPPPPPPHHPPPHVAAFVVILNAAEDEPTVSITFTVLEFTAEDVHLTLTLSPGFTIPVAVVNAPPLILYSPPDTDTIVPEANQLNVTALLV